MKPEEFVTGETTLDFEDGKGGFLMLTHRASEASRLGRIIEDFGWTLVAVDSVRVSQVKS